MFVFVYPNPCYLLNKSFFSLHLNASMLLTLASVVHIHSIRNSIVKIKVCIFLQIITNRFQLFIFSGVNCHYIYCILNSSKPIFFFIIFDQFEFEFNRFLCLFFFFFFLFLFKKKYCVSHTHTQACIFVCSRRCVCSYRCVMCSRYS